MAPSSPEKKARKSRLPSKPGAYSESSQDGKIRSKTRLPPPQSLKDMDDRIHNKMNGSLTDLSIQSPMKNSGAVSALSVSLSNLDDRIEAKMNGSLSEIPQLQSPKPGAVSSLSDSLSNLDDRIEAKMNGSLSSIPKLQSPTASRRGSKVALDRDTLLAAKLNGSKSSAAQSQGATRDEHIATMVIKKVLPEVFEPARTPGAVQSNGSVKASGKSPNRVISVVDLDNRIASKMSGVAPAPPDLESKNIPNKREEKMTATVTTVPPTVKGSAPGAQVVRGPNFNLDGETGKEDASPEMPTILDAQLAEERASRDILVIDGERETDEKAAQRRKYRLVALAVVLLAAIIGAGVAFVVMRNSKDVETTSPTPDPTSAPTTDEFQDTAIRDYLADLIGGGPFVEGSPEATAAEWIINEDAMQLKERSFKLDQRFGLALFYLQLSRNGRQPWKRCNPPKENQSDICVDNSGEARWMSGADECTWHGVICREVSGEVIGIELTANGLSGKIPRTLPLFSKLLGLTLVSNDLTGEIPEEVYTVTSLRILSIIYSKGIVGTISPSVVNLTNLLSFAITAGIGGTIPTEIGSMSQLEEFRVEQNPRLKGSLPEGIYDLTKLTDLRFGETSITGTLSTKIGRLTSLLKLAVANAAISGTIPSEIGLLTSTTILQIAGNFFEGSLPSEIGRLTLLDELALQDLHQITGSFPEELYDLTELKSLAMIRSSIGGTLSTRIGKLTNLLGIDVQRTNISGPIPTEIGSVTDLRWFLSGSANLSGPLPSELGKMTMLNIFAVEHNREISGTVPEDLYELTNLQDLTMFNTSLSGTLSSNIGQMRKLEWLSVGTSAMSGAIPSEIGACSKLTNIDLREGNFSGPIPSEIGQLRELLDLTLRSNGITGSIPEELYTMSNLEYMEFEFCSLSGSLSRSIGNLTNLVYIQLEANPIVGSLPSEIGNCANLKTIALGDTQMTGSLPTEIGRVESLEYLDCSESSGIGGPIPESLFDLDQLDVFNIFRSSVSGTLSTKFGSLSKLRWLILADTKLTGTVPTELGKLESLETLALSFSEFVGPVPNEICENKPSRYLFADCLPVENPTMPCPCCTDCCDRETKECQEM